MRQGLSIGSLLSIIIFAVGFAVAAPANAAGTAVVAGRVTTPIGAPLANAQVSLTALGGTPTSVFSDAQGYFQFVQVAPGSYSLTTSLKGYVPSMSAPFTVAADQHESFTVVLQPQSTTSIVTLGRITVNGRASLNTSSASSTTLSTQQFIDKGQQRVDAGISNLPGVTINQGGFAGYSAPGAPSSLSIRGAGNPDVYGGDQSYENLVLQDGEPLRNGFTGGFDLSSLTPAIYERVELIEGVGGTSLFGANAIGGTLNLVTRNPLRTEGGQAWLSVGSYGTTDLNIMESNTVNRFGYLLDYHAFDTDGAVPGSLREDFYYNFFVPDFSVADAVGTIDHPSQLITLRSGLLKLRYDLSPSTYVAVTGSNEADYRRADGIFGTQEDLFIVSSGTSSRTDPLGNPYFCCYPSEYMTNIQPKGAFELHTLLGGGELILRAYDQEVQSVNSDQDGPLLLAGGPADFIMKSADHLTGQLASWTKSIGRHTFDLALGGNGDTYAEGFGFGRSLSVADLPPIGQGREIERTYLVRDDYQASSKLDLSLTNYYSTYDTLRVKRDDPRIGFVFRPDINSVVRASVGTGFAAPSLQQLYTPTSTAIYAFLPQCPGSNPDCGSTSGNANIQADRAFGYSLGFEHDFANQGQVNIDLYRTNLTDHIYEGVVPAPAGLVHNGCCGANPILYLLEPINITRAAYQGVEATGTLPIGPTFSLGGTYDVQAAFPIDIPIYLAKLDQVLVSNQQFIGIPLHKFGAALKYGDHTGASAFFEWNFIDKNNQYNQPAFSLYNAGVNMPMAPGYTLHVADNNIFGAHQLLFSEIARPFTGYPYPGFSGPFGTYAEGAPQHTVTVTLERKFGALR